jgi:AraC-like DNA-binding protein
VQLPLRMPHVDWLHAIVGALQRVIGTATFADTDVTRGRFRQLIDELPSPRTPQERLLLRGLLLEFACKSGSTLHALAHHGVRRAPCPFQERSLLIEFFSEPSDDPRRAFLRWSRAFFAELYERHPPSAAKQASRLIQKDYRLPLSVPGLARHLHVTASQLRRAFHREFGMGLRDYCGAVRLLAAIERVMQEKTESTALEVGYKSKKNYYRNFKKLTGLTPTEFRRLSEERRRRLVEAIRSRLHL